jgi:hypothetical protein
MGDCGRVLWMSRTSKAVTAVTTMAIVLRIGLIRAGRSMLSILHDHLCCLLIDRRIPVHGRNVSKCRRYWEVSGGVPRLRVHEHWWESAWAHWAIAGYLHWYDRWKWTVHRKMVKEWRLRTSSVLKCR